MQSDLPVDEVSLIKACKEGSLKHQELLYKRFYGFAMGVCLRYSLSRDDAAEAINDSFIKVFKNIGHYSEAQPFKAWFRTIIVNTAIDRRRKEIRHQLKAELTDTVTGTTAGTEHIISRLNAQDILNLLNTLPPLHCAVFNLHEIDGYSHEEIGSMLGFAASSSRVYLSRAKDKLKRVLKSESEIYGRSAE